MYASITEKVVGSTNTSERKILADDVNQIRQVIQTGEKDLKTKNVSLLGNTITADNGANWIRRNGNTFQFHNGTSWQEPSTATLLTFTAGENIAARDVVYLKVSDGKIYKASTANNDWIGVATAAITSGASGTIYPNGSLVGGFSGLTSGTWYGLNATAGTLTANENYIVGKAISATQIILLKPKGDMSTRDNALYKLQGEKAINDVSATNSGVLAGSSQVLIDKFLNATGQNNTVDTGNITGIYDSSNKIYTSAYTYALSNVILEPSFETITNWTYAENDPHSQYSGSSSSAYSTEGTKSYLINVTCTNGNYYSGDYGEITQIINLDYIDFIKFDYKTVTTNAGKQGIKVLLDNTEIYSRQIYSVTETLNDNIINVVSYKGNHTLKFRMQTLSSSSGPSTTFSVAAYFDNIRTQTYTDSIVQSAVVTVPTGMTKVFVTPLMYEALSAGDSVTADVSINAEANYINQTSWAHTTTETNKGGIVFTARTNRYLKSVTRGATVTATTATLQDSGGSTLATATFSGQTATFATRYQLTAGTTYRLVLDSGGSNYTMVYNAFTLPTTYSDITLNSGIWNGAAVPANIYNIEYITIYEGTAEAFTEDIPINTWTPITSANGTSLIVKANLNTNDGTTTPKVLGWRVLLE